jgi:hypothetical protein
VKYPPFKYFAGWRLTPLGPATLWPATLRCCCIETVHPQRWARDPTLHKTRSATLGTGPNATQEITYRRARFFLCSVRSSPACAGEPHADRPATLRFCSYSTEPVPWSQSPGASPPLRLCGIDFPKAQRCTPDFLFFYTPVPLVHF